MSEDKLNATQLIKEAHEEFKPLLSMKAYKNMGFSYEIKKDADAIVLSLSREDSDKGMDITHTQNFHIRLQGRYDQVRQQITESRLKFFEMG